MSSHRQQHSSPAVVVTSPQHARVHPAAMSTGWWPGNAPSRMVARECTVPPSPTPWPPPTPWRNPPRNPLGMNLLAKRTNDPWARRPSPAAPRTQPSANQRPRSEQILRRPAPHDILVGREAPLNQPMIPYLSQHGIPTPGRTLPPPTAMPPGAASKRTPRGYEI